MQTFLSRHPRKVLFKLAQFLFFQTIPAKSANLKLNHTYGTLTTSVLTLPQYLKPKKHAFFTKYQHIKHATLITYKDNACTTTKSFKEEGSNLSRNLNENIIKVLNELAEREMDSGDMYRERAYKLAIKSISEYPKQITSGKEAKKLKGIGESISSKIDEIIETGTCSQLWEDGDQRKQRKLIDLFMKVPKIGKKDAQKLVEKGYKSLEDVMNDPEIEPYKKFGIQYVSELDQDASREEIESLIKFIAENLASMDVKYKCILCVQALLYSRRGAITCRDLNMLITHSEFKSTTKLETIINGDNMLKKILDNLKNSGFCTDYLHRGNLKFSAICQLPSTNAERNPHLHRLIEFRILPYEQFWLGVLARTGNAEFYRLLQKEAEENNYFLNDTTFARKDPNTGEIGPPIPVTSEGVVFEALNLKFIPPFARNLKKDDYLED
ncbi:8148_t:CDS:2 [Acaulospora morrowiae]|uniref:DNA polymerase n=1 Tax=Acaulospora morrowiae TaxID=94023 RepID=A0A9N9FIZ5_9GLOM|nr:8148_t:CDS:2 [Acaulospora morrowiae]